MGRKITADDISSNIAMREDIPVTVNCIHGDREQSDREAVSCDEPVFSGFN